MNSQKEIQKNIEKSEKIRSKKMYKKTTDLNLIKEEHNKDLNNSSSEKITIEDQK